MSNETKEAVKKERDEKVNEAIAGMFGALLCSFLGGVASTVEKTLLDDDKAQGASAPKGN